MLYVRARSVGLWRGFVQHVGSGWEYDTDSNITRPAGSANGAMVAGL